MFPAAKPLSLLWGLLAVNEDGDEMRNCSGSSVGETPSRAIAIPEAFGVNEAFVITPDTRGVCPLGLGIFLARGAFLGLDVEVGFRRGGKSSIGTI